MFKAKACATSVFIATLTCSSVSAPSALAEGPVTAVPFTLFVPLEHEPMVSEACGFDVQVTVSGQGMERTLEPAPGGLRYFATLQSVITFSSADGQITFQERGQERAVENADGSFTFSYIGRFFGNDSIGRQATMFSETGPRPTLNGKTVDLDRICEALSAP